MLSEGEFRHKRNVLIDDAIDTLDNPPDFGTGPSERQVLTLLADKIEALVMLRTHTERG